jgi:hypothetical protein
MVIKSTVSKRRSIKPQVQERRKVHYEIDIRPLKVFASEKFPRNCPLREALLAERDILEAREFLAKMETWLNLLRITYC